MTTTTAYSYSYSYSTSYSYSYSYSTDDGIAYIAPAWGQAWCTAYNAVKVDPSWISEFTKEPPASVYPGMLADGTGVNDYTCADIESWGTRDEAKVDPVYSLWVERIDDNCCVKMDSTAVDCASNPTLPECQTAHPDQNAGDKYNCMCEAFGGTAEGAEGWKKDKWIENGIQINR